MIPPLHWWRTVFFLIPAISAYTIVLGTISLVSGVFSRSGRIAHHCARLWSWLILATTGVVVHARGLERVPEGRACLFVANHQSIYDIPILFWTLAVDLRIIAKASLGRFPFLGWHLSRAGHVLVHRDRPGSDVFNQVAALMRAGRSLLVFPEGTRSRDGRVARFRGGIFLLAIESGLPVVPVAVAHSRHVMLKGRLMTCPGEVVVEILDLIETGGLTRDDAKTLAVRAQQMIASRVEALERAGVPDAAATGMSRVVAE